MSDKLNILVIDDQKVIGDLFDFTLGFGGHTISVVTNLQEALDCIRDKQIDLVFLDMVMPDKDGIEVLKEIRQISSDLPVIVMSGYSVEDKKEKAIKLGAKGFLKKPFELDDIKRVIKSAIGKEI